MADCTNMCITFDWVDRTSKFWLQMKIWVLIVCATRYQHLWSTLSRKKLTMKIHFFANFCLFFKQNEIVSDRKEKNVILFLYWNLCVITFLTIPILSVWNVRTYHTRPLKVGLFGPNLMIHHNDYLFGLMLPLDQVWIYCVQQKTDIEVWYEVYIVYV